MQPFQGQDAEEIFRTFFGGQDPFSMFFQEGMRGGGGMSNYGGSRVHVSQFGPGFSFTSFGGAPGMRMHRVNQRQRCVGVHALIEAAAANGYVVADYWTVHRVVRMLLVIMYLSRTDVFHSFGLAVVICCSSFFCCGSWACRLAICGSRSWSSATLGLFKQKSLWKKRQVLPRRKGHWLTHWLITQNYIIAQSDTFSCTATTIAQTVELSMIHSSEDITISFRCLACLALFVLWFL